MTNQIVRIQLFDKNQIMFYDTQNHCCSVSAQKGIKQTTPVYMMKYVTNCKLNFIAFILIRVINFCRKLKLEMRFPNS